MTTLEELHRIASQAMIPPADNGHLESICVNPEHSTWSDKNPSYVPYFNFLYLLCDRLTPPVVVELGTELGRAACFMAEGSPMSEIITIELGGKVPSTWIEWLGKYGNVRIISGTDSVEWGLKERLIGRLKIDLLFIDSNHERDHTLAEWCTYRPMMAPGGLVCFDDVNSLGVRPVWDEVSVGLPHMLFDAEHYPDLHPVNNGFGVVCIPT